MQGEESKEERSMRKEWRRMVRRAKMRRRAKKRKRRTKREGEDKDCKAEDS